jgi:hypothetical protein
MKKRISRTRETGTAESQNSGGEDRADAPPEEDFSAMTQGLLVGFGRYVVGLRDLLQELKALAQDRSVFV